MIDEERRLQACRQEHDCIEIAEAIKRLRDHGRTCAEIAGIFGKHPTWVSQMSLLPTLHPEVQTMLQRAGDEAKETRLQRRGRGRMTLSIGLLLAPLDQAAQLSAAKKITTMKMSMAGARNYIRKFAAKTNTPVGRETSPHAKFEKLWNAVEVFRHAIEPLATADYSALMAIAGFSFKSFSGSDSSSLMSCS